MRSGPKARQRASTAVTIVLSKLCGRKSWGQWSPTERVSTRHGARWCAGRAHNSLASKRDIIRSGEGPRERIHDDGNGEYSVCLARLVSASGDDLSTLARCDRPHSAPPISMDGDTGINGLAAPLGVARLHIPAPPALRRPRPYKPWQKSKSLRQKSSLLLQLSAHTKRKYYRAPRKAAE